jgi:hypothetical protein
MIEMKTYSGSSTDGKLQSIVHGIARWQLRKVEQGFAPQPSFWPVDQLALLFVMLSFQPFINTTRARAQDRQPAPSLLDTSIEDLMSIEIDTVSGASRFKQKVTEAPASVTIITSNDIAKYGYRTLADILRNVQGFYVTYDRNYSWLGVRGYGPPGDYNSRIALMIDGHRLNDNIFDAALIGTEFPLDVDLIDREEVIRGPIFPLCRQRFPGSHEHHHKTGARSEKCECRC